MRLTPEVALKLGLIEKAESTKMEQSGKRGAPVLGAAVAKLNASKLHLIADAAASTFESGSTTRANVRPKSLEEVLGKVAPGTPSPGSKEYRELAGSPQKILFDALCLRLPGRVQWEAEGLVPGRMFSADIFIPPNLIVEMDGFRFHKSKTSFQKDRDRQNLFVAHGFRPIRVYAKQVFNAEMREELIELIARAADLP